MLVATTTTSSTPPTTTINMPVVHDVEPISATQVLPAPAPRGGSSSCCCSMSLKMPTAARQAISYVTNLFSASTSTAQISTELSTKSENGKGSFAHHHQPNHHNSVNGATNKLMPPTGMTSPTHSNGSSDISDESILNWEPDVHEKELVKKTWSDDFDFLYELGAAIYTYIFEHNPNTKQLFPTIHRHGEHWKDSKEFRSQALKFVQTLAHVVKNLYHMERLAPYLYKIGEIHVKFAKRGFKPEFWNSFLDAMEVALADTIQRNPELTIDEKVEATQVWRRLAHYVISHMKRGYSEKEASCHE
uniref:GLOBIN domain-containing protein n=1 Tax=Panagrellus redivivus TaxID=6233 RepID=A0A7E4VWP7_PANRE